MNQNLINDMKRFLAFIFVVVFSVALTSGQYKMCCNIDGYWGPWQSLNYKLYGNYHQISIYHSHAHPSQYAYKFTIDNFREPSKEEKKNHLKSNTWYEYTGTFEYYISDAFPTAKDAFLKTKIVCPYYYSQNSQKPVVRQTVAAIIRIAPYKNVPQCYNIIFEDLALGLDLCGSTFTNW